MSYVGVAILHMFVIPIATVIYMVWWAQKIKK